MNIDKFPYACDQILYNFVLSKPRNIFYICVHDKENDEYTWYEYANNVYSQASNPILFSDDYIVGIYNDKLYLKKLKNWQRLYVESL